jgi:hypothetical protein
VSSSKRSHLTIQGGSSTLQIELLDSDFSTVATGTGALSVHVSPGLYEVHFRDGASYESRIIKAEGATVTVEPPRFLTESPAPLEGTSTSHEYHQYAVSEASQRVANEAAHAPLLGGLIVMVRNLRGADDVPFPSDLPKRLGILDAQGKAPPVKQDWQIDATQHWAIWSNSLPAGGYTLEISGPDAASTSIRQSLWVDRGWQTLLFLPNTAEGIEADLATVHITKLGQWSAWNEAGAIAVALENVLAGLRNGRSVVPSDLNDLFHAKFQNPFLGIAAAHALLLDPSPSTRLLTTVVKNLARLLPENPDVFALEHRAYDHGAKVTVRKGLSWPPLLYAGYRSLIRADAADPGVILDGSPAETAAARLVLNGIWTTWTEQQPDLVASRGVGAILGEADLRWDPMVVPEGDPATERLRSYVTGAAELQGVTTEEILGRRTLGELALATGLPSGAVSMAISSLRSEEALGA